MNKLHQAGPDCDLYFTMTLIILDVTTGNVDMCQCGHPAAIVKRKGGQVEFMGEGGCPIGLIPFADYETLSFQMFPEDRLFLYSDGLSECENASGVQFDDAGLSAFFRSENRPEPGEALADLMKLLDGHRGAVPFNDDISAILLEMTGERFKRNCASQLFRAA